MSAGVYDQRIAAAAAANLTCVPGINVISEASIGSIFVDGAAFGGLTTNCTFRIGLAGAETHLYNVSADGDSGFTTFRIYGACSLDMP